MTLSSITCVGISSIVFFVSGCGTDKEQLKKGKRANDLEIIGFLYRDFENTYDKPPINVEDLKKLIGSNLKDPDTRDLHETLEAITRGQYVIIWKVKSFPITKTPAGKGGTILGYEKDAPISGGLVLMVNGKVKDVTASEFQSTPKAQGE